MFQEKTVEDLAQSVFPVSLLPYPVSCNTLLLLSPECTLPFPQACLSFTIELGASCYGDSLSDKSLPHCIESSLKATIDLPTSESQHLTRI